MPTHPVLYWRDNATRTALTSFDTLDKLIAAKPLQVVEFDDTAKQIEKLVRGGDDSVTNEPGLNPDGTISVYKQQGRSPVPTMTIQGNVNASEVTLRQKLDSFSYKKQVEHEYHEFGIIGFFHPTLTDFNKDPTDLVGYTMGLPIFDYDSPGEIVKFRINLSLGVQSLS
jgi:hypothetical protein